MKNFFNHFIIMYKDDAMERRKLKNIFCISMTLKTKIEENV